MNQSVPPCPDDRPEQHSLSQPDESHARVLSSTDLFQGRHEVWIDHEGTLYRLRQTGTGKLYLSK
ncbi:hemin uptake protein HemP [Stieleria sp. TO1_6]|nr:hemin uptake protein HemP [Stieleria tagensis]